MLKVVVKRSKWLRGRESKCSEPSVLLSEETSRMCCLGFASKAAGVRPCDMRNEGSPAAIQDPGLKKIQKKLPKLLVSDDCHYKLVNDSDICNKLMNVNDDPKMRPSRREARLKRLGKLAGINFSFVD